MPTGLPHALCLVRATPDATLAALRANAGPRATAVTENRAFTGLPGPAQPGAPTPGVPTPGAPTPSAPTPGLPESYRIIPLRSGGWVAVLRNPPPAAWDNSLAKALAQAAGLRSLHAGFDDAARHGATAEVVHYAADGTRRSISVTGRGAAANTLALGEALPGEPGRAELEALVAARDAAGAARRLVLGIAGVDPWAAESYEPGAIEIVARLTWTPAPIVGGPAAPRPRKKAKPKAPGYLASIARPARRTGRPAALLADGAFCGHGEPTFGVWDLSVGGSSELRVALPLEGSEGWPVVRVQAASGDASALAYDSRQAPASEAPPDSPAAETAPYRCAGCGGEVFAVSVGFEFPGDSESPEDVSWFALAIECTGCRQAAIAWDHETA